MSGEHKIVGGETLSDLIRETRRANFTHVNAGHNTYLNFRLNAALFNYLSELQSERLKLATAVDAFEWIMPKVHQAYHEGELSDCQKSTCAEYRKTLAKIKESK